MSEPQIKERRSRRGGGRDARRFGRARLGGGGAAWTRGSVPLGVAWCEVFTPQYRVIGADAAQRSLAQMLRLPISAKPPPSCSAEKEAAMRAAAAPPTSSAGAVAEDSSSSPSSEYSESSEEDEAGKEKKAVL